jgi:ubiquinone/menaquinone biosynthesis C-methylase UbiE
VTEVVAAGYDAVYAAWSASARFHATWARNAVDGEIADGFEHLNFARLADLERLRQSLDLTTGARLVDLACGAGGPGAWVAQQTGAVLIGVDVSRVGTRLAARRAVAWDLPDSAFVVGSVDHLPLVDRSVVGAMSLDSLQYVPDKRATFSEVARVLIDGGRFVFTAFEVDPARVRDVPVLGVDPVPDYSTVLRDVGLTVDIYEETLGWHERLVAAYSAVIAAESELRAELGDSAMDALLLEMSLTLEIDPYPRRVFAVARSE